MSESLYDDLQYVQLVAKEQHRRKRRLERLNKTKRKKFQQQSDHSKYEEWRSCKHNKYKKAGWVLNIYLEYETKSIYNNNDNEDRDEHDIDDQNEIITTTTTTTATVIINNEDDDDGKQDDIDINIDIKEETDDTDTDIDDIENKNEEKEDEEKSVEDTDNISLSKCFEAIECDFDSQKIMNLSFPSTFIGHITSLYESSTSDDINGLLKSARYWNLDKLSNINICGQAVVIGSYLDELINIFADIMDDCPLDIIYCISELVGNAIIWLRKPGLNIFKWSATSTVRVNNINNINMPYKYKQKIQTEHENIRKWKFKNNININKIKMEMKIMKNYGFNNNEFFFSGYIGNDKMADLLNENIINEQYIDLDWCFVVFLLLGLVPKNQNKYFKWYFNQKLLSALPGNYPFKSLF